MCQHEIFISVNDILGAVKMGKGVV